MWTTSVARRAASESASASLTATIAFDALLPAGPDDPHRDLARGWRPVHDGSWFWRSVSSHDDDPDGAIANSTWPFSNRLAVLAVDGDDLSADARLDVVHQLHHLDDAHRRRGVDGVADVGERG